MRGKFLRLSFLYFLFGAFVVVYFYGFGFGDRLCVFLRLDVFRVGCFGCY